MHRLSDPQQPAGRPRDGLPISLAIFGSCAGFRLAGQCEQAITIDMLFEVIGKQVERGVDIGFIVEAGGLSADEF